MFVEAYKKATKFTQPVISMFRYYDGTVEAGLGTFIHLNDEGWIMTVGHILHGIVASNQHKLEIQRYEASKKQITENQQLTEDQKKVALSKIMPNNKWVTHTSLWWGADNIIINQFHVMGENDFAIGKIENYKPAPEMEYPTIIDPSKMSPGRSLCKLGHPFHPIKANFNYSTQRFEFVDVKKILPIPRFPMEGMYTRNVSGGKSKDGKYDILFIETSTPGLKGQSGGPIFDPDGTIWGVQSKTNFLDLGFTPKIERNGIVTEENQFLNVGLGVHPKTIIAFLNSYNVKFTLKE